MLCRFLIADVRSAGQHAAMMITPAVIAQLPLADIGSVVFYKRDEITTDLICCDVEVAGRVSSFNEEAKGWDDLIAHLSALPGFRADWYEAVASPAFTASETVAFDRR
ncbi:hypothetical protein M527_14130 [Sphingobium indicum IP26]|nr:hypothetical protein M527_01885 [Sphingobium indicum IP26]EPR16758.1 hypothetical protein M527_19580 [Sphingobium indicum IP26]EPR18000.1 hypothetical protein M527_14130 [Sphingobium indicum IP26]